MVEEGKTYRGAGLGKGRLVQIEGVGCMRLREWCGYTVGIVWVWVQDIGRSGMWLVDESLLDLILVGFAFLGLEMF